MKAVLVLGLLFAVASVQADSFTIIRDGKRYMCEQEENYQPDPNGAIECRNQAYSGPFTKPEAETLCQGSYTPAPAICGLKAYDGAFTKAESITLCQRARSNGPAECAEKAYADAFSKSESVELCQKTGTVRNADCAIKAYGGAFSKVEAIRICKSEPQLILRALDMIEQLL